MLEQTQNTCFIDAYNSENPIFFNTNNTAHTTSAAVPSLAHTHGHVTTTDNIRSGILESVHHLLQDIDRSRFDNGYTAEAMSLDYFVFRKSSRIHVARTKPQ